jgi:PAS domain S-box-containing protein
VPQAQRTPDPGLVERESSIGRHEATGAAQVLAGMLDAATSLAIVGTDPGGRIAAFSAGAERLFDVPAAQVVARASPVVFLDPGELEACVREAAQVLGRRPTGFEALVASSSAGQGERAWTMRRPTGSTFPATVTVAPVHGERGEVDGYVVIVQEITERRAIERMKDDFIGAVSHELRTPLSSMLGALRLLEGGVAGEVSPAVAELVEIAHANGERLLRLVNDLLDAQRLASGRFDLERSPCDPADVVARAIELTLPLAETAGVLIGTVEGAWEMGRGSAPPSSPGTPHRGSAPPGGAPSLAQGVRILADFDRLVQVVVNLLSNAIKFSPPGEQVIVGCERRGEAVRISVADRGPGIPESFRSRIFGRFMQARVSDATARGGSGLGLSIAKSIVELHGGTLGFDTETGKGTTFHVDLPVIS